MPAMITTPVPPLSVFFEQVAGWYEPVLVSRSGASTSLIGRFTKRTVKVRETEESISRRMQFCQIPVLSPVLPDDDVEARYHFVLNCETQEPSSVFFMVEQVLATKKNRGVPEPAVRAALEAAKRAAARQLRKPLPLMTPLDQRQNQHKNQEKVQKELTAKQGAKLQELGAVMQEKDEEAQVVGGWFDPNTDDGEGYALYLNFWAKSLVYELVQIKPDFSPSTREATIWKLLNSLARLEDAHKQANVTQPAIERPIELRVHSLTVTALQGLGVKIAHTYGSARPILATGLEMKNATICGRKDELFRTRFALWKQGILLNRPSGE